MKSIDLLNEQIVLCKIKGLTKNYKKRKGSNFKITWRLG